MDEAQVTRDNLTVLEEPVMDAVPSTSRHLENDISLFDSDDSVEDPNFEPPPESDGSIISSRDTPNVENSYSGKTFTKN